MKCRVCGAELDGSVSPCAVCGSSAGAADGAADVAPATSAQSGAVVSQSIPAECATPSQYAACSVQPALPPMKWFKFIVYFQLFAGAALLLLSALQLLTGMTYGSAAASVYLYYGPGLKALDVTVGVASVALAALFLAARQMLVRFKKTGPAWYFAVLAANAVLNVVYLIVLMGLTGIVPADIGKELASSVFSPLVLIAINVMYFKKRKHLFVN